MTKSKVIMSSRAALTDSLLFRCVVQIYPRGVKLLWSLLQMHVLSP